MSINAGEAIERLKAGNAAYVKASRNTGDISQELVQQLSREGQAPYACIVACADSRVVPEHIFMAGLGGLFTIRVAGNVIGDMELASCVYAAEHLGVKLIVVLGHTQCGAVASTLEAVAAPQAETAAAHENALSPLIASVAAGIGDERDPVAASVAHARFGTAAVMADSDIAHLMRAGGLQIRAALYHTETGTVEFLD